MGYTTNFSGRFNLDRPLNPTQIAYLKQFAGTRRMRRDPGQTELRPDQLRIEVGLPIGVEGGYFVSEEGMAGQGAGGVGSRPSDVVDYNRPPAGQPGLWCQWIPTEDGTAIVWDEGEKFYDYVEWLEYIIEHFLKPWGFTLSGAVAWDGEERSDIGEIRVRNNVVKRCEGRIVFDS